LIRSSDEQRNLVGKEMARGIERRQKPAWQKIRKPFPSSSRKRKSTDKKKTSRRK